MAAGAHEAEFSAFVRSIRGWLRQQAYELCGDWHEADDLVQAALLNVFQRWERLDRRTELGAYARRSVVHSFLSERRRARWRREVVGTIAADAVATDLASERTAVEDRAALLPALQRLGPRQRAVVTLRFLGDLSIEQTAEALGCEPSTVTSQTTRALENLRRELGA